MFLFKKKKLSFFHLFDFVKLNNNNKLKHYIITMESLLQHKSKITVTNVCREDTFKATYVGTYA